MSGKEELDLEGKAERGISLRLRWTSGWRRSRLISSPGVWLCHLQWKINKYASIRTRVLTVKLSTRALIITLPRHLPCHPLLLSPLLNLPSAHSPPPFAQESLSPRLPLSPALPLPPPHSHPLPTLVHHHRHVRLWLPFLLTRLPPTSIWLFFYLVISGSRISMPPTVTPLFAVNPSPSWIGVMYVLHAWHLPNPRILTFILSCSIVESVVASFVVPALRTQHPSSTRRPFPLCTLRVAHLSLLMHPPPRL
jgi:hypothetical protein